MWPMLSLLAMWCYGQACGDDKAAASEGQSVHLLGHGIPLLQVRRRVGGSCGVGVDGRKATPKACM